MAMSLNVVRKNWKKLSKPLREIQNEIQRITNFKYVRDLRFEKNRGGFKGFRIKTECNIKIE